MSILDKFLSIMKLDDEDDFDDDFFDEDDEVEEVEPKKSLINKFKKSDKEEEFDEEPKTPVKPASTKVTPMRQPARRGAAMEVCVIKPSVVDEAREITETLLSGRTVILNLEGLDLEIAQRIIDFTSGATFAISGNLQKISNYIFLVTPANVDISGDLQDLLNTSFDVPSMKLRY
jgi:cell division inhibitor SepF